MNPIVEKFLPVTFNDNRSSKRTDLLHDCVLETLCQRYPEYGKEYKWKFEYRLKDDAYGGTFDIDIVGFRKDDPKRMVAILCKAINSSYNKNSKNYANTVMGECHRMLDSEHKFDKILFVNIIPNEVPNFTNEGVLKSFEIVKPVDLSKLLYKNWGTKVEDLKLRYDIKGLRNKLTKMDFKKIEIENMTDMELEYDCCT